MTTARPGAFAPLGYQQITNVSAAVGVTVPAAADKRTNCALIRAETQSVRWRDDATNPTTTVGQLLPAGTDMWYEGDLNAIKFIETTASASLSVSFYEKSAAG